MSGISDAVPRVRDFAQVLAALMEERLAAVDAARRARLAAPLARARAALAHGGDDPATLARELGALAAAVEQAIGATATPEAVAISKPQPPPEPAPTPEPPTLSAEPQAASQPIPAQLVPPRPPAGTIRRTPLQELRDYPFFPPDTGDLPRPPRDARIRREGNGTGEA